jgi:hypothetical protein
VQRGSVFYFYNLQEELVMKVLSAVLLGKTSEKELRLSQMEEQEEEEEAGMVEEPEEMASSGCCGGGGGGGGKGAPALKPQKVSVVATPDWYVRDSADKVHGPMKQLELQLLFRYHVFPGTTMVSTDGKEFRSVASHQDVFANARKIETLDPTEIPTF